MMRVLFVNKSGDRKTGAIPVSYQSESTCPPVCPHKDEGCYAQFSFVRGVWNRINQGLAGGSWKEFLQWVIDLPLGQLWRYAVAGDLPGKGNRLNKPKLIGLVEANKGKRGFTYTHKPMTEHIAAAVRQANQEGFTINLSSDSPKEADDKMRLKIGPVVMTMPEDPGLWPEFTPDGHRVVPCPAITHKDVTCKTCQLCAIPSRKTIIGFPAHGSGRKKVEKVYFSG